MALDLSSARLDAIPWNTALGGANPGNSMQRAIAAMYLREWGQRSLADETRWWNRFNSTNGDQWGPLYVNDFTNEVKGFAAQGFDRRAQYPASAAYGAYVLDPTLPPPPANATNPSGGGELPDWVKYGALAVGAYLLLGGGGRR